MKIVYRATVGDYKAAHRMLRRENWFLRYDQLIWWLVLSLFIAVGVATGEVSLLHRFVATFYVFPLIFAIGLPILRNLKAYLAYRASLSGNRANLENSTEISERSIVDTTRGICELSYEWSSVTGVGQDDKVTLLRMQGGHYVFFPTSALSADDRAELDALAKRYAAKRWS